ncbi:MAG: SEC-C metal-binding domain-containing protein [Clostridiales bacterium]
MLDKKTADELNKKIQEGYSNMMDGESAEACIEWEKVWKDVVSIMKSSEYENLERLDNDFIKYGGQYLLNWTSDFEMELGNAVNLDVSFAQIRIDFCSEYINFTKDKEGVNTYNMRRAIAESYFELGDKEKGDKLFKKYLEEKPTWGWIGWSDMYWISGNPEERNDEKAIKILKQALEVDELEDKADVQERLKSLYVDIDMDEEAKKIVIDKRQDKSPIVKKVKTESVVTELKIGRNDPCPCGSGKKYKKCCMN